MQKLLIYNKGYSNTGKSQALKAVFFRLIAEHGELIHVKRLLHGSLDFCNTDDLGVIFTYRGILVGLESEGDPKGTYHEKALTEFKKDSCEIVICACHTKGETINILKEHWMPDGEYIPAACPHFVLPTKCVTGARPEEIYRRLSENYADSVIALIDMWIDGVCQYNAKEHHERLRNMKPEWD